MVTAFSLANLQISVNESSLKNKKQDKIQCSNQEVFKVNKIQSVHENFSWKTPLYFCFANREKNNEIQTGFLMYFMVGT